MNNEQPGRQRCGPSWQAAAGGRAPCLETPGRCQQIVGVLGEVQPQRLASVPILEPFQHLHCKIIVLIPHGHKRGTCRWRKSLCSCSDLLFAHRVNESSMPDPDPRWPLITKNQGPASCKGLALPSLTGASSLSRGLAGDPFPLISHPSALLSSAHPCLSLILLPSPRQGHGNGFVRVPRQVDLQKGCLCLFSPHWDDYSHTSKAS